MPIPFEAFMQRALHDPDHGYYAKHITTVGGRGDFTTAPMLSSAPAQAIARWATQALRETGCRDLIEIGPGNGTLAQQVWKLIPWHLRWRCRLHLVESSAPLTQLQQDRLKKNAHWHKSIESALTACDSKAVIFSNELVDAFPVRRFEKTADGWQEIAVSLNTNGRATPPCGADFAATESLIPCDALPESSIFDIPHSTGQRVEVHESYRRWLNSWLPLWKAGRILTIDYGAMAETLYHRRPRGTLRGYLLHQRLEGLEIYQNIGRQDLTADVNFTDLTRWSEPWTQSTKIHSFAEFLQSTDCDPSLTDPDGAGNAFLVLDQSCRE